MLLRRVCLLIFFLCAAIPGSEALLVPFVTTSMASDVAQAAANMDLPNTAPSSLFLAGIVATYVLSEPLATTGAPMLTAGAPSLRLHDLPEVEELKDACYLISDHSKDWVCYGENQPANSCELDDSLSAYYGEPIWRCSF